MLVPLAFFGRNFGEWSSVIGSFESPKITLLRTLVGLMTALWLLEWAIQARPTPDFTKIWQSTWLRPKGWPGGLSHGLAGQPMRWLTLAVLIYVGSTLLSTFLSASFNVSMWGDVPGQDSYSAYTVVAYVLLFGIIATHLKTQAQLHRILGAVVIMGVLVSGYAIFQHYTLDFLDLMEPPGKVRATSTMGGAIFAASLMVITLSITLMAATYALHRAQGSVGLWWQLGLWAAALSVQLLGLIFTSSRGPWLGSALGIASFIAMVTVFVGWRAARPAVLVIIVAGAVSWAVLTLSPGLTADPLGIRSVGFIDTSVTSAEQATARVTSVGGQSGLSGRLTLWKSSWQLIASRPWFEFDHLRISYLRPLVGYGPELFRAVYLLESPPGWRMLPSETDHAHNFFLHQGVELGMLGLAASLGIFVAPLLAGAYQLVRRRREYSAAHQLLLMGLLAVLAGRMLEQMLGVARVSDLAINWVILAVFIALPRVMRGTASGRGQDWAPPAVPVRRAGNSQLVPVQGAYRWLLIGRTALAVGLAVGIGFLTWDKSVSYSLAAVIADRGAAHSRHGDRQQALSSLEDAAELAPDVSTYYLHQVILYEELQSGRAAAAGERCGTQEDRQQYEICLAARAYQASLKWVEQRPFDFRSRLTLAHTALRLGLLKGDPVLLAESTRWYREATQMVPNSWMVHNQLAAAYIRAGRAEAALPVLDRSLSMTAGSTDSFDAMMVRQEAYQAMGRPDEAIVTLTEVLQLDPTAHSVYRERGKVHYNLGRYGTAIEDLSSAIGINPEDPDSYYQRGTAYYQLGRSNAAVRDFSEAIRLDPNHTLAYNDRGLAYANLGKNDLAMRDFAHAILLDPQLALAYNNRGFLYRDLGQPQNAIQDLDRALARDPQFATAYFNRALAYAYLGRDAEAQRDVQRATELGLDPASILAKIEEITKNR
jgi:tetratricopeptide (TPR) repeat protein/O-antigen ligase